MFKLKFKSGESVTLTIKNKETPTKIESIKEGEVRVRAKPQDVEIREKVTVSKVSDRGIIQTYPKVLGKREIEGELEYILDGNSGVHTINRRKNLRVCLNKEIEYTYKGRIKEGQILDISREGVRFETNQEIPRGIKLKAILELETTNQIQLTIIHGARNATKGTWIYGAEVKGLKTSEIIRLEKQRGKKNEPYGSKDRIRM